MGFKGEIIQTLTPEQRKQKEKFAELSNMMQTFVHSLTQKTADSTLDVLKILNAKLKHEGLELGDFKLSKLISFPLKNLDEQPVDFSDGAPFDTYDHAIEDFIKKICAN